MLIEKLAPKGYTVNDSIKKVININGKIEITGLKPGKYKFVENDAYLGLIKIIKSDSKNRLNLSEVTFKRTYFKNNRVFKIAINNKEQATIGNAIVSGLKATDEMIQRGQIELTKTDKSTGEILEGAIYKITYHNGESNNLL